MRRRTQIVLPWGNHGTDRQVLTGVAHGPFAAVQVRGRGYQIIHVASQRLIGWPLPTMRLAEAYMREWLGRLAIDWSAWASGELNPEDVARLREVTAAMARGEEPSA